MASRYSTHGTGLSATHANSAYARVSALQCTHAEVDGQSIGHLHSRRRRDEDRVRALRFERHACRRCALSRAPDTTAPAHTPTHTHSLTHTHTHSLTHSHTHTLSLTRTRTLTHLYTHALSRSPYLSQSLSLALSLFPSLPLSLPPSVTLVSALTRRMQCLETLRLRRACQLRSDL